MQVGIQVDGRRTRNRASLRRLGLGLLSGTAIVLVPFWLMISNNGPWQFNYLLMPGAIVAVLLGVVTHYCDYCYAATLLGVNVIFYGTLTYAFLSLPVVKRHLKTRN